MNWLKFRELLVYIASKSETDPRFGAVKLNKILYYSDFTAHRQLGHSITEAEYQNLEEGPAPRELLVARRELVADGSVDLEHRPYFNGTQQRLTARRRPDLTPFVAAEIQIVDQILGELLPLDGKGVTDASHEEFGWRATVQGETIPYSTAWIGSDTLTADQLEAGMEVAERHGLLEPAR